MKRMLLIVLAVAFSLPLLAHETAVTLPAPGDANIPAPVEIGDPAATTFEGRIVVAQDDRPGVVSLQTADDEFVLLPGEKLTELLAVEGFADKIFVIEGQLVLAHDGDAEGIMISSFSEKQIEEAPVVVEPTIEEGVEDGAEEGVEEGE